MGVSGARPLGVGEILDAGIKVYLRNARTLMGLAAIVVVPVQALSWLVLLSIVSKTNEVPSAFISLSSSTPTTSHDAAAKLGADVVLLLVQLVAGALTTAACVKAVSDLYLGNETGFEKSLRFAARRLLPLLAMEVLYGIGISIGFLLLIVPGIWLYGAWSVNTQALLIERCGPAGALGRSRELVKGRWWPTAGVVLVSSVMTAIVSGILQALFVGTAFIPGEPSVLLAVTVVTVAAAISSIIVTPFVASVRTILYYDLRIRREGYDVDLLAEQLGLPVASLPAPARSAAGARWGSSAALGPESVGQPGGPPFWPPPPGWRPEA